MLFSIGHNTKITYDFSRFLTVRRYTGRCCIKLLLFLEIKTLRPFDYRNYLSCLFHYIIYSNIIHALFSRTYTCACLVPLVFESQLNYLSHKIYMWFLILRPTVHFPAGPIKYNIYDHFSGLCKKM